MRFQTACSSSAAVTFPRAKAQRSGAATQLEKMPENTLSESVHSSKSLPIAIVGQNPVAVAVSGGGGHTQVHCSIDVDSERRPESSCRFYPGTWQQLLLPRSCHTRILAVFVSLAIPNKNSAVFTHPSILTSHLPQVHRQRLSSPLRRKPCR
jgi:hypothetical protein